MDFIMDGPVVIAWWPKNCLMGAARSSLDMRAGLKEPHRPVLKRQSFMPLFRTGGSTAARWHFSGICAIGYLICLIHPAQGPCITIAGKRFISTINQRSSKTLRPWRQALAQSALFWMMDGSGNAMTTLNHCLIGRWICANIQRGCPP